MNVSKELIKIAKSLGASRQIDAGMTVQNRYQRRGSSFTLTSSAFLRADMVHSSFSDIERAYRDSGEWAEMSLKQVLRELGGGSRKITRQDVSGRMEPMYRDRFTVNERRKGIAIRQMALTANSDPDKVEYALKVLGWS